MAENPTGSSSAANQSEGNFLGGESTGDSDNPNVAGPEKEGRCSSFAVLLFAFLSFFLFAVAEIFGAWFSHSLSLLGDATTMIVDSVTYLFNMYAEYKKPGVQDDPVAILKLELYSPLVSVIILLGVSGYILNEAVDTVRAGASSDSKDKVNDTVMLVFAAINLFFDILNLLFFFISGHTSVFPESGTSKAGSGECGEVKSNTNMCSAYTHLIADTLRSIAVLLAAIISKSSSSIDSELADAWAAIVVSFIIFLTALPLLHQLWRNLLDLRRILQRSQVDGEEEDLREPLLA